MKIDGLGDIKEVEKVKSVQSTGDTTFADLLNEEIQKNKKGIIVSIVDKPKEEPKEKAEVIFTGHSSIMYNPAWNYNIPLLYSIGDQQNKKKDPNSNDEDPDD